MENHENLSDKNSLPVSIPLSRLSQLIKNKLPPISTTTPLWNKLMSCNNRLREGKLTDSLEDGINVALDFSKTARKNAPHTESGHQDQIASKEIPEKVPDKVVKKPDLDDDCNIICIQRDMSGEQPPEVILVGKEDYKVLQLIKRINLTRRQLLRIIGNNGARINNGDFNNNNQMVVDITNDDNYGDIVSEELAKKIIEQSTSNKELITTLLEKNNYRNQLEVTNLVKLLLDSNTNTIGKEKQRKEAVLNDTISPHYSPISDDAGSSETEESDEQLCYSTTSMMSALEITEPAYQQAYGGSDWNSLHSRTDTSTFSSAPPCAEQQEAPMQPPIQRPQTGKKAPQTSAATTTIQQLSPSLQHSRSSTPKETPNRRLFFPKPPSTPTGAAKHFAPGGVDNRNQLAATQHPFRPPPYQFDVPSSPQPNNCCMPSTISPQYYINSRMAPHSTAAVNQPQMNNNSFQGYSGIYEPPNYLYQTQSQSAPGLNTSFLNHKGKRMKLSPNSSLAPPIHSQGPRMPRPSLDKYHLMRSAMQQQAMMNQRLQASTPAPGMPWAGTYGPRYP